MQYPHAQYSIPMYSVISNHKYLSKGVMAIYCCSMFGSPTATVSLLWVYRGQGLIVSSQTTSAL